MRKWLQAASIAACTLFSAYSNHHLYSSRDHTLYCICFETEQKKLAKVVLTRDTATSFPFRTEVSGVTS